MKSLDVTMLLVMKLVNLQLILKRTLICRQLQFGENGDPSKVLHLSQTELRSDLSSNEVRVSFLASPINPADINTIQGVYGVKPKLPAIGGNEGVARVEQVGSSVSTVRVGDWIQPKDPGGGTWRTAAIFPEQSVFKVDNSLPLALAATILINPPTAYRLLNDFVQLNPGDTVVQNGANSGVGRALIQLAKARGLVTVNVVRSRPDIDDLRQELQALGADHVLTDEQLKGADGKKLWINVPAPKLAINCVSGRSTLYLASCLAKQGKLVTYGAMSMQPVQLPAGALIFNGIQAVGFWLTAWKARKENQEAFLQMMQHLTQLAKEGKLKAPACDLVPFTDYKTAIEKGSLKGYSNKQILVFDWTL